MATPSDVMVQRYNPDPTFTPLERTQLFEWRFTGAPTRRSMAVSPDGRRFLLLSDATATNAKTERGHRSTLSLTGIKSC